MIQKKKIKSKAVEMAWMLKHLLCNMRSGVRIPRTSINAGQEQKPANNPTRGAVESGERGTQSKQAGTVSRTAELHVYLRDLDSLNKVEKT